jgi:hypothetical protein
MFLTILSRGFQIMAAGIILALSGVAILTALTGAAAMLYEVGRPVAKPVQETRTTTVEEFVSCGLSEDDARFLARTHAGLRRDANGAVRCD